MKCYWMWSSCDIMWTRVRIWADVVMWFTGCAKERLCSKYYVKNQFDLYEKNYSYVSILRYTVRLAINALSLIYTLYFTKTRDGLRLKHPVDLWHCIILWSDHLMTPFHLSSNFCSLSLPSLNYHIYQICWITHNHIHTHQWVAAETECSIYIFVFVLRASSNLE